MSFHVPVKENRTLSSENLSFVTAHSSLGRRTRLMIIQPQVPTVDTKTKKTRHQRKCQRQDQGTDLRQKNSNEEVCQKILSNHSPSLTYYSDLTSEADRCSKRCKARITASLESVTGARTHTHTGTHTHTNTHTHTHTEATTQKNTLTHTYTQAIT